MVFSWKIQKVSVCKRRLRRASPLGGTGVTLMALRERGLPWPACLKCSSMGWHKRAHTACLSVCVWFVSHRNNYIHTHTLHHIWVVTVHKWIYIICSFFLLFFKESLVVFFVPERGTSGVEQPDCRTLNAIRKRFGDMERLITVHTFSCGQLMFNLLSMKHICRSDGKLYPVALPLCVM